MTPRRPSPKKSWVKAVAADRHGQVFELDGYAAVGSADGLAQPLVRSQTINTPFGSELMMLPERQPVVYNIRRGQLETLFENPYAVGQPVYPVAVFNSPGYVITGVSAYETRSQAGALPLFSYGAVGWSRGRFRSAAVCVDRERRQDIRLMPPEGVRAGIAEKRRKLAANRLCAHLEKCALIYGCPAAKNFFLGRCEAPLPTSPRCNAGCLGCLSLQRDTQIPRSQDRIEFKPSAEEIAEVALSHIRAVKKPVVSFGQGCEGDPLLAADVIEPAIRRIRAASRRGTIHMNTNGSLPGVLDRLVDAGLDSLRVSLNSVRASHYHAYVRPRGFGFADVLKSIAHCLQAGRFVAINYLNCPGFTDTPKELDALAEFLQQYRIHMIQWRNLNFDPHRYWKIMARAGKSGPPLGMTAMMETIRKRFPGLKHGYFNPPRERFAQ
jgi:pyruvate-formate lyase-activating enzyme